jgi:hypothetical protein
MVLGAGVDEHFNREFIRSIELIFSHVSERLYTLKASNNLVYAQGEDLNNIASLLNVNRFIQEEDEEFRTRLLSYVNSLDACGTSEAFVKAFKTRFDYDVIASDTTPIPTVKISIDAQTVPGYDLSVINYDDVEYTIEMIKAAGVNYVYELVVYANNNSDVEGVVIKENVAVLDGIGSILLIYDEGTWDDRYWG